MNILTIAFHAILRHSKTLSNVSLRLVYHNFAPVDIASAVARQCALRNARISSAVSTIRRRCDALNQFGPRRVPAAYVLMIIDPGVRDAF